MRQCTQPFVVSATKSWHTEYKRTVVALVEHPFFTYIFTARLETQMDITETTSHAETAAAWPPLPYTEWQDTCETLHLYLQVVGKVKLELCPFLNQWWEVALLVSARGLSTGPIPLKDRTFDVEFDFVDHRVAIHVSDGQKRELSLTSQPVAEFYRQFMDTLHSLGIDVQITTMPSEIPNALPLDTDTTHRTYDGEYARRWWTVLLTTERIMNRFRAPFHGKSSPVNLFWGGMDLNHTRFNGQLHQTDPKLDRMMRFGENEANFSTGFWPGSEQAPAAFYAYMTPAPEGVEKAQIQPASAQYVAQMGEFFFPYDAARQSDAPEESVFAFFQSTYAACAGLAGWDRTALEGDVPDLQRTH